MACKLLVALSILAIHQRTAMRKCQVADLALVDVFSQESHGSGPVKNRITIPGTVGTGGAEVILSMTLSITPQTKVKRLTMEFGIPPPKISFLKTELAYEAIKAGADARVEQVAADKVKVRIVLPEASDDSCQRDRSLLKSPTRRRLAMCKLTSPTLR